MNPLTRAFCQSTCSLLFVAACADPPAFRRDSFSVLRRLDFTACRRLCDSASAAADRDAVGEREGKLQIPAERNHGGDSVVNNNHCRPCCSLSTMASASLSPSASACVRACARMRGCDCVCPSFFRPTVHYSFSSAPRFLSAGSNAPRDTCIIRTEFYVRAPTDDNGAAERVVRLAGPNLLSRSLAMAVAVVDGLFRGIGRSQEEQRPDREQPRAPRSRPHSAALVLFSSIVALTIISVRYRR